MSLALQAASTTGHPLRGCIPEQQNMAVSDQQMQRACLVAHVRRLRGSAPLLLVVEFSVANRPQEKIFALSLIALRDLDESVRSQS